MNTLREALENTPTGLLREMARTWGVDDAEKAGRPGLAAGLLEKMSQEEAVQAVLRLLDREERDLLRQLLAAGGRLPAPTLTRTYGPLRSADMAPDDWGALNPLERLHRRGLLFRAMSAWEDYRGPAFFVPAELWPFLPRVPRARPEELLPTLPAEEVEPIPLDLSLHRDMAVLLALLRRETHTPNEDGQYASIRQSLREIVLPLDFYQSCLLQVARQARLAAPDIEGALRPTAEAPQWLRAAPAMRTQVLFQAWSEHTSWDELAHIPELLVERPWAADTSIARGKVLRHLAACPGETWLALGKWVQMIESVDPEFLRPGGAGSRLRVRRRESGVWLEGVTSWNEVEGRYLRALIQGPLYWLGAVELGESPVHGLAFRVTALGQALLHPGTGLPPLPEEPIMVEGTFDVWVPPEAAPYAVFVLEGCAERAGRDRVSRYHLTRPAWQRALQRGERHEALLETLSRYGRGPVPQNVVFNLEEWSAAYGQLSLRQRLLLSAADTALLDEVLADPVVRAACGERLAPGAVEVLLDQVMALEERLGQLGRLPQVEEGLLARGERIPLTMSVGQAAALLALLGAVEELVGSKEAGRALAGLAERLVQRLPAPAQKRARRMRERWLRERQ